MTTPAEVLERAWQIAEHSDEWPLTAVAWEGGLSCIVVYKYDFTVAVRLRFFDESLTTARIEPLHRGQWDDPKQLTGISRKQRQGLKVEDWHVRYDRSVG